MYSPLAWLKTACPSCYVYPYDDMSSTFQCATAGASNTMSYVVEFCQDKAARGGAGAPAVR